MLGAPRRLRCEYLRDPLGIDVTRPRLSWCVNDSRPAEIQTAYQLLAARNSEQLDKDIGGIWDTGRVSSQHTLNVEYAGEPLHIPEAYAQRDAAPRQRLPLEAILLG